MQNTNSGCTWQSLATDSFIAIPHAYPVFDYAIQDHVTFRTEEVERVSDAINILFSLQVKNLKI